jgi:hypothetical protein
MMKTKLTILILTLITIASLSCKKKNCCVMPPANTIFALKNNTVEWRAPSEIHKPAAGVDTVVLAGHVGEETLRVILKKDATGFTLTNATYWTTIGQDVISSSYVLDKNQANTLTVTANTDQLIEGTFMLYFKPVSGTETSYPGTITFKSGIFRAAWQ